MIVIRKERTMDIGEYRGQRIHRLTCLGEGKEKEIHQIVRCDCGVIRSIPRGKFGAIKTCGCQRFGGEKKKEFIYHGGLNELKPKKAALSKELFYKSNVSGCEMPVGGILTRGCTNSATMYVIEAFTRADRVFARQQGRRFVVRKKDLFVK